MSIPKRHHTVPRVYLDKFVEEDGRLTITSKRRETVFRHTPSKALTRYHYYSQPVDGVRNADQTLEAVFFNELETKYPNLFSSLLDTESMVNSELLTKTILAICIRSPAFREAFEIGLAEYVDNHRRTMPRSAFPPPPAGFEDIWDSIVVTIDPHRSIHAMAHYLNRYAKLLAHLEYRVFLAPKTMSFLTSDNPVVWFESRFGRRIPEICIFEPTMRTRAVFPISPKAAIIGKRSRTMDFRFIREPKLASAQNVREINEVQLACAWDSVIGDIKLPRLSVDRLSHLASSFVIDAYNPNTSQFSISAVELSGFKEKYRFNA